MRKNENTQRPHSRLAPIALVCALFAAPSCQSDAAIEQARLEEQQAAQDLYDLQGAEAEAEDAREAIEATPVGTEGRDEAFAEARSIEASLERSMEKARAAYDEARAQRERAEALSQGGLVGTGVDIGTDVATGNYPGALETIFGLGLSAVLFFLNKRRKGDVAAAREEFRSDIERWNARRDETRAAQGIAPASARSAEAAKSPVAHAVAVTQAQDIERQVNAALAARLTPQAPPLAPQAAPAPQPAPPAARTSDAYGLSGGVGVPQSWPMPPGWGN